MRRRRMALEAISRPWSAYLLLVLACAVLASGCRLGGGVLDIGTAAPRVSLEEVGTGAKLSIPDDLAGTPFGLIFFSYG